jgi:hypothetical protein
MRFECAEALAASDSLKFKCSDLEYQIKLLEAKIEASVTAN